MSVVFACSLFVLLDIFFLLPTGVLCFSEEFVVGGHAPVEESKDVGPPVWKLAMAQLFSS